jgi:hypothetical protein
METIVNKPKVLNEEKITEPKKYNIVVVNKGSNHICINTFRHSFEIVIPKSIALKPKSVFMALTENRFSICLNKPVSKDIAETYVRDLNDYLKVFTDNNKCNCGTNIAYEIKEI